MKRIIAAVSAACLLGQTAYAFDNVSVQFGGGRINVSASLGDTQAGSAVKLILLKPGATGVNAETLAALTEIYVGRRISGDTDLRRRRAVRGRLYLYDRRFSGG